MPKYVIINLHGMDITEKVARSSGTQTAVASNGRRGAIYELDDEEEAEEIRKTGLFVEKVGAS